MVDDAYIIEKRDIINDKHYCFLDHLGVIWRYYIWKKSIPSLIHVLDVFIIWHFPFSTVSWSKMWILFLLGMAAKITISTNIILLIVKYNYNSGFNFNWISIVIILVTINTWVLIYYFLCYHNPLTDVLKNQIYLLKTKRCFIKQYIKFINSNIFSKIKCNFLRKSLMWDD